MKIASLGLVSLLAAAVSSAAVSLPRSAPEAQGVSSSAMLQVIDALDQRVTEMHSIIVVRNGHVIAEGWWSPFAADEPHMMFSLSKSFTSTAVGMAVAEGKLNTNDLVTKFFPEDMPAEASTNLRAMRIRDLLTMSTGHHEADFQGFPYNAEEGAVKKFLSLPVSHKPGTYWVYNTPATFMLSAIVQKVTGQPVHEYLRTRLYEPLGIVGAEWEANREGISMGGFGLEVTTEDIAKFGQLYLQKGAWNGKQLVPAAWIDTATARQASNGSSPNSDWEQGYGYQFWRCKPGFYRGDGAHGQFCIVMEQQNTVVAITSGTADMASVMNTLWATLLPALEKNEPLPENAAAHAQLKTRLAGLSLKTPVADAARPAAPAARRFAFPENRPGIKAIVLDSLAENGDAALTLQMASGEEKVIAKTGSWTKAEWKNGPVAGAIATSGAWTNADTYTLKLARYHTPFVTTYRLKFAGDELQLEVENNVGPANARVTKMTGKSETTPAASE